MSQVFVRPENVNGDAFLLRGPEAHHVVRVLRHAVGDKILLFDGTGGRWCGTLTFLDPVEPSARGRIDKRLPDDRRSFQLRLFQGLPRGSKFDLVIEKAVELGADEIHPFLSKKSPVKLTPEQAASKLQRWRRLAEAAAKQSERSLVPMVAPVLSLSELAPVLEGGRTLLFVPGPASAPLKNILEKFFLNRPSAASDSGIINIVVGPESGFTDEEVELLVRAGASIVSLGSLVLRTETAGFAALAILRYHFDLL